MQWLSPTDFPTQQHDIISWKQADTAQWFLDSSEFKKLQLIDKLRDLQTSRNVRLLFTSRFIPEVTQYFQSCPQLEVRASEEDVRRFVEGQIPRLPTCIHRDAELKSAVQTKIVEAVDGM